TSMLYNALSSVFQDEVKALDVWSYTYTEDFNNIEVGVRKDSNGEALASDVLKHLENESVSVLTKADVVEIQESGLPVENTEELYDRLYPLLFENGLFSVSVEALRESALYTEKEIANIMYSPKIQSTLKNILTRMKEQSIPI